MAFKRGEIYLANLNPTKGKEPGKIRPVLILQSDFLNEIHHPTVIIAPITTKIIANTFPLRFDIAKQDGLMCNSSVLCDQIRTIDTNRMIDNRLTQLSEVEMLKIQQQIQWVLAFD